MKKSNAIILCRVSSKKQAKEGDSLESQEKICREYCSSRNINIIKVIVEEGVSGKLVNRDSFKEIKELAQKKDGGVDYLVFLKLDRFGRMNIGEYERIKGELEDLGIKLRDVHGVIQDKKQMLDYKGVNMSKYNWNYEDSSQMSQSIGMLVSHHEGKAILQRTIPHEVLLALKGYVVGNPPYGYKNVKEGKGKKSKILEPKDGEKKAVEHIFEWRAEGKSDSLIAEEISILYKKRNGKAFEAKDIQRLVANPKYAGVYEGEWTGGRAIGIKCTKPIVSVKEFNAANRGKMKIIDLEKEDEEFGVKLFDILYKNKGYEAEWNDDKLNEKKIKNIENENFPYTKLIYSPYGKKLMSGSISTGRKGDKVPYYHATVPFKDQKLLRENYTYPITKAKKGYYYGVQKAEFEKVVVDFLGHLKPVAPFIELYKEHLKHLWNARRIEIEELNDEGKTSIVQLENEAARISNAITRLAELAGTDDALAMKSQELKEVKNRIEVIKNQEATNHKAIKKAPNLDDFIKNGIFLLEHIKEAFINAENYNQRKFIFDVIFDRIPYYDELTVGTQVLSPLWAYIKQKSQTESEINDGSKLWLPKLDSNQGPTG